MKQEAFERERSQQWSDFAAELDRVTQGYRLPADVAPASFVRSYREISRDLALAKSRGYSHQLVKRLNELVIRGHNTVYVRRSGWKRIVLDFLRGGFAVSVRRAKAYLLVSTLAFAGSGAGVVWMIGESPERVYSVLSADQVSVVESMYDPGAHRLGTLRQADSDFQMFGFYIMNNISIGFQVFATGLLFGVGSLFYLIFNGVNIGAVGAHLVGIGYGSTFVPFIAGHGPFELTAIALAGAAGLMLGHALIAPGASSRLDALRQSAKRAIEIVMGATLMLLIAAFIEAFWSSSTVVPALVKVAVGIAGWVLVVLYFVLAGRRAA